MRHAFLAVLLALINWPASSQAFDTLVVGSEFRDRQYLKPGEQKFIIYIKTKDSVILNSLLTKTITVTELNGKQVLLTVEKYQGGILKSTDYDSSFVDYQTLQPIEYRSQINSSKSPYREKVSFTNSEIQNVTYWRDSTKENMKAITSLHYNSVNDDDILRVLPLGSTYKICYRIANTGLRYATYLNKLSVTGQETINIANSNPVPCWLVEIETGSAKRTYWVTQQTRDILRMKILLRNGSEFWRERLY